MTVTAINGSPKGAVSNSLEVISILKSMLPPDTAWQTVSSIKESRGEERNRPLDETLVGADVLVIAFPLYVDGLPSTLMEYLERYAAARRAAGAVGAKQRVFAVANCGFYEGEQNRTALEIVAHFCASAGLDWCGGAGLGTGEMILALKNMPKEAGIRKPVIKAIRLVADAVASEDGMLAEPVFTQHAFPWLLYKLAGEAGWRSQVKKSGLARKDLDARPLESMAES